MLSQPEFLSDTESSGDEIYESDLIKDKNKIFCFLIIS
jgi:hypothetical protein